MAIMFCYAGVRSFNIPLGEETRSEKCKKWRFFPELKILENLELFIETICGIRHLQQ